MKKKLMFALVMVLGLGTAALKAEATDQDWAKYNTLKAEQKATLDQLEAGTFQGTTTEVKAFAAKYETIADLTTSMGRQDITAWQYNNAAYALIKYFKQVTAWDATMDAIKEIPNDTKENRQSRLNKAREIQKLSKDNLWVLDLATDYLNKADGIDEATDEALNKVASNQDFVAWVSNFVQKPL